MWRANETKVKNSKAKPNEPVAGKNKTPLLWMKTATRILARNRWNICCEKGKKDKQSHKLPISFDSRTKKPCQFGAGMSKRQLTVSWARQLPVLALRHSQKQCCHTLSTELFLIYLLINADQDWLQSDQFISKTSPQPNCKEWSPLDQTPSCLWVLKATQNYRLFIQHRVASPGHWGRPLYKTHGSVPTGQFLFSPTH